MITINPYGSYVISFVPCYMAGSWELGRPIRGFTLLSVFISYIIVFYMTSHLRPILRSLFSGVVAFVGLMHYEFWWWAVGLQFSVDAWPGRTFYYGVYTICLFMFLFYVNLYIKVLDVSRRRILMLVGLYSAFILSWVAVVGSGFYQQFLLYGTGTVPDPHNFWWAVNKTIGVIMWVTIVRSEGK